MKGGDEKRELLEKWLSLNIMKEEMNKRKFIYIKIFLLILAALCFVNKPMTARADGIPVSLGYVPFDEHRGMSDRKSVV